MEAARITFFFADCPLCKKPISHPALEPLLAPLEKLKDNIKAKSLQRLLYEGLDKDPQIVNKDGKFYNDPEGFAFDRFSYFSCYECKNPYCEFPCFCILFLFSQLETSRFFFPVGGMRQCDDGQEGSFNPKEMICGSCSGKDLIESCPKHGKEYIVYKCRFCCSVAAFFCWSTHHFCFNCHKIQCEGNYLNRKDKHQFPVCKGKAFCPLKIDHPHVEEFALGCSLCSVAKNF